jgi:hypothetical protein
VTVRQVVALSTAVRPMGKLMVGHRSQRHCTGCRIDVRRGVRLDEAAARSTMVQRTDFA